MKVRNNTPSFGARVKIDYNQLEDFGNDVVKLAEKIRPRLVKRGKDLSFTITRSCRDRLILDEAELSSNLFLSSNKIIVKAKRRVFTLDKKLRKIFRKDSVPQAATADFSENGLMRAAIRAEKRADGLWQDQVMKKIRSLKI